MLCHCNMYVVHYKPSVCDVMKHGWKNEDERLQQCHADPCVYTHTHRHTWLLWFSFFFNQEVPEWNSWTTLFGRNDGCWSLVRWPYMHLRHWRCCGRRRWWAPPTPHRTSYLVSGLAGGLGRGWLLAMGGTPSTLQRVGWMWMNVCLWAVCECVCVCL